MFRRNTVHGMDIRFQQKTSEHSSGKGAKYTRGRLPVKAVYIEFTPDKSSALKREAAIKKLTVRQKLTLISSQQNAIDMLPAK